jgi:hypothetical protein
MGILIGKLSVSAAETHGFRQIRHEGACGVRWRVLALFRYPMPKSPWRESWAAGRGCRILPVVLANSLRRWL